MAIALQRVIAGAAREVARGRNVPTRIMIGWADSASCVVHQVQEVSRGSHIAGRRPRHRSAGRRVPAVLPAYPAGTYLLALRQSDGTLSNLFYLTLGAVVSQAVPVASTGTPAADGGVRYARRPRRPLRATERGLRPTRPTLRRRLPPATREPPTSTSAAEVSPASHPASTTPPSATTP